MWFKKHLNWTFVLASLALPILVEVPLLVIVGNNAEPPFFTAEVIVALLLTSVTFGVGSWVLYEKRQCNWFILTVFLGLIGIIVILLLNNKQSAHPETGTRRIGQSILWGTASAWVLYGLYRIISEAPIRLPSIPLPNLPWEKPRVPIPPEPAVILVGDSINLFFFLCSGIVIGTIAYGGFSLIFNRKLRQSPLAWFWGVYTPLSLYVISQTCNKLVYPDFIGVSAMIIIAGIVSFAVATIIYFIVLAVTKAKHRT